MRSNGNFHSEWAPVRGKSVHHTVLNVLVACAVGAASSATVTLSMVDSPIKQPSVSSTSSRVIVRNADASEAAKTAQDRATIETAIQLGAIGNLSDDQPVAQTEAKPQAKGRPSPQSRKHNRLVTRWHEPYWGRRSTHNFSRQPHFSAW